MHGMLLLPELLLLGIATLLLCVIVGSKSQNFCWLHSFMGFAAAGVLAGAGITLGHAGHFFNSGYRVDLLSQGFKLMIAGGFFFTALLSKHGIAIDKERTPEYYVFLCTATLGMMMITSAVDILSLYVSLELSSYSLYLLAALGQSRKTAESGVKYLLFGAAASGVMLWGLSLIAGLSGTFSLAEISAKAPVLLSQPAFLLGVAFVALAFLFKLSGFPMHFWAPDVYESASTPATNLIATASKAAAVALLVRLFMFVGFPAAFTGVFAVLAFFSMTIGNTVALLQKDVKRLLAYSSVAQAGYLLVGLLAGSTEGYSSAFFYAFAYVLMNTGAFLVTVLVAKSIRRDNPEFSDFNGLAEKSPLLALVLLLSLLSLAGIPPLAGFTGKWILFSAAMEKGHWFLVLWGVLNSVVSLFYYLTLVKHAYLEKPKNAEPLLVPFEMKVLCLFLFLALVLLGVFPNYLITYAQKAAFIS